jgi:membrane-bound lytic murein transglycosylase A
MRIGGLVAVVMAALVLQACATGGGSGKLVEYPERPELPPPTRPEVKPLRFADLPGWEQEDHAAALDAFRAGCAVSRDAAVRDLCVQARSLGPQEGLVSRAFLEANFRPVPVFGGPNLLTAYFAPRYEGRMSRQGPFTEPVRARPTDLLVIDLTRLPADADRTRPMTVDLAQVAVSGFDPLLNPLGKQVTLDLSRWTPAPTGTRITGRVRKGALEPYADRAGIIASEPETVLAWMKPEDLFFLQIQGSGILTFPDGRQMKAAYAIGNGKRFAGIATPMKQKGLLAENNTSGERIHGWLAENRGPQAEAIMNLNPSYVFFTMVPYDGQEPAGAAGVPLPAGRAIAVDSGQHRYGQFYWIDAAAPTLAGAFPRYRRAVMALDTGGAIRGSVRADLYMGTGDAAGAEAGRVKHQLKMYRLAPITEIQTARAPSTAPGTMAPIPW